MATRGRSAPLREPTSRPTSAPLGAVVRPNKAACRHACGQLSLAVPLEARRRPLQLCAYHPTPARPFRLSRQPHLTTIGPTRSSRPALSPARLNRLSRAVPPRACMQSRRGVVAHRVPGLRALISTETIRALAVRVSLVPTPALPRSLQSRSFDAPDDPPSLLLFNVGRFLSHLHSHPSPAYLSLWLSDPVTGPRVVPSLWVPSQADCCCRYPLPSRHVPRIRPRRRVQGRFGEPPCSSYKLDAPRVFPTRAGHGKLLASCSASPPGSCRSPPKCSLLRRPTQVQLRLFFLCPAA